VKARVLFGARFIFCLVCLTAPRIEAQHAKFVPQLHPGQTFFYQIEFGISREMKTESRVVSPQAPQTARLGASGLLMVEVIEASPAGVLLKTYYSERGQTAAPRQAPRSPAEQAPGADKAVEVLIAAAGAKSKITGYDQLSTAQQLAWTDWLGRFTSAMAFPKGGIRIGQKWDASEAETTPSPIAGLVWSKKSEYVEDQPCGAQAASGKADENSGKPRVEEVCAVILIRATLRQKSSPKNATPPDFKQRNLKTSGTAAGQNETILYISRATGLLVRSNEDATQAMDVVVALEDGSNEVRNILSAKSHSEIRLVQDVPKNVR